MASRLFHAQNDKEAIAAWRLDLNRVLQVFNVRSVRSVPLSAVANISLQTELAINTHVLVSDIHRKMVTGQEGTDGLRHSVSLTLRPPTTGCSPFSRFNPGQSPRIPIP